MLLLHGSPWVIRSAGDHLADGAVCIEGDRIREVGPSADLLAAYPHAQRIDCAHAVLAPGLINAHNHIYGVLCRGLGKSLTTEAWLRDLVYPATRALDADDMRNAALLVCAEAVRTGTTAIVEQATNQIRHHVEAEIAAFAETSMRGAIARGAPIASVLGPEIGGEPDDEVAAMRAFVRGAGDVQRWVGPSGLFSCDPDTLVRLKGLATEEGTRFLIHLGETRAQRGQVDTAHRLGLLDADTVVAHAIWSTPEEIAILAETGAHVVHSPTSNMLMGSGIADLPAMLEAGVRLALGADTPAANDAQDMLAEVKATGLLQRVAKLDPAAMDARTCWRLATEGGASALGLNGQLGRLEPGWLADVIGFQVAGNPGLHPMYDPLESLVYHGSGRDVCLTIIGGKVMYDHGTYPTIDLESVLHHVRTVAMPKVRAAVEG